MIKNDIQVDMHIHTTASDGTWTAKEALDLIVKNNIKVFSITDHDTIQNSIKILNYIPNDICYIIGTEISCTYDGQEYHITAYDFDYKDIRLNELLEFNRRQRGKFNNKIIEYASKINRIVDIKEYHSYQYNRKRGGWESLNYLIDKNIVKNLSEYFEIIKLSNERLSFKNPTEIIEIIKGAGGHSFLAHPSAYGKGKNLPLEVLREWESYGISGIECFSPYLNNIEDANYYTRFCEENDLMISAGSDCHGEFNNRTLGIPKVSIDKLKFNLISNKG